MDEATLHGKFLTCIDNLMVLIGISLKFWAYVPYYLLSGCFFMFGSAIYYH